MGVSLFVSCLCESSLGRILVENVTINGEGQFYVFEGIFALQAESSG
jgi:hypothetical protein